MANVNIRDVTAIICALDGAVARVRQTEIDAAPGLAASVVAIHTPWLRLHAHISVPIFKRFNLYVH